MYILTYKADLNSAYLILISLQCIFLGWCTAPFSWSGATFIYSRFIAPFVIQHEKEVDRLLKQGTHAIKDLYGKG